MFLACSRENTLKKVLVGLRDDLAKSSASLVGKGLRVQKWVRWGRAGGLTARKGRDVQIVASRLDINVYTSSTHID